MPGQPGDHRLDFELCLCLMALVVKNPPASAGDARDAGSNLWLGRSPGVGHGRPFQYSCLENSIDSGVWQATVHGATKESDMTECSHTELKGYIPNSSQIDGFASCSV